MPRVSFRWAFTALVCLVSNCLLSAQTASAAGGLSGRVLNPATGEYVRNAQIRLVETGATTVSEAEGLFSFSALPAGRLTLVVTYTGYRTVTTPVEIAPGATTTKNIELISDIYRSVIKVIGIGAIRQAINSGRLQLTSSAAV